MARTINLKDETYLKLAKIVYERKKKAIDAANYSAVNTSFDDIISELLEKNTGGKRP